MKDNNLFWLLLNKFQITFPIDITQRNNQLKPISKKETSIS